MAKKVDDKNVEVNGRVIGANSVIRLNVKTAVWIIGIIFTVVMSILSYSYFDLKKKNAEFVNSVDQKIDEVKEDVTTIRLGQEAIKGDIKLILDRQNRDNPVNTTAYVPVQPVVPPTIPNVVDTSQIQ